MSFKVCLKYSLKIITGFRLNVNLPIIKKLKMNQFVFGKELVRIRKLKGLTQSELADKCNVSCRTIQRIENGIVVPRSFTIKALSKALDIDLLKDFPIDTSENERFLPHRFILRKWIITQIIELFNLKTKAMRKLSILTITSGLLVIAFFTFLNNGMAQDDSNLTNFLTIDSNECISQNEAIKTIESINKKAQYHNQSIDLILTYAEESNYNYNSYVHLAKLVGSFGHSTQAIMEIANIVFLTHNDCYLFNDIASLIFLETGFQNNIFVQLAKEASEARTEDEIKIIRIEIDKYKEQAKYNTLEEAFESQ